MIWFHTEGMNLSGLPVWQNGKYPDLVLRKFQRNQYICSVLEQFKVKEKKKKLKKEKPALFFLRRHSESIRLQFLEIRIFV